MGWGDEMLMMFILSWGCDITIRPVDSVQEAHDFKRRNENRDWDIVVYDSVFLMPFRFDIAWRQLADSEVEELRRGTAFPALVEEGRMEYNRSGRPVLVRA